MWVGCYEFNPRLTLGQTDKLAGFFYFGRNNNDSVILFKAIRISRSGRIAAHLLSFRQPLLPSSEPLFSARCRFSEQ